MAQFSKNYWTWPKNLSLSSKKYGFGIRDPRSGIQDPDLFRIWFQGSRSKIPDPDPQHWMEHKEPWTGPSGQAEPIAQYFFKKTTTVCPLPVQQLDPGISKTRSYSTTFPVLSLFFCIRRQRMSSLLGYSHSAPNLNNIVPRRTSIYSSPWCCRWRMWLTCWEWPRRRPWASFSRSGESNPISSTSLKPKPWKIAWNNMRRKPRIRSSLTYLKGIQLYWRGRAKREYITADGSRKIGNVGVGVNCACVTV